MYRIGQSRDIHKLESNNRRLIVAGVLLPFDKGPVSHSDGDVVYHALAEALLGSLPLREKVAVTVTLTLSRTALSSVDTQLTVVLPAPTALIMVLPSAARPTTATFLLPVTHLYRLSKVSFG